MTPIYSLDLSYTELSELKGRLMAYLTVARARGSETHVEVTEDLINRIERLITGLPTKWVVRA